MPSSRPCAAFEPISPDFDVKALVESTPNFEFVVRIHCDMIDHQGIDSFHKLVLIHVILSGKPLVIEGYQERLDKWTFALQWLRDNYASKIENARDLTKKTDVPLSIGHYLNNMALLTNQWNAKNYKDRDRQRMYLKDIDCPQIWQDKLADLIPLGIFYLNGCTGDIAGLGSVEETDPNIPGVRRGRGVAKAGDLMSGLPKEMRAENLMCYIGHEGTYTPAHREMCASLGQNIMVEASTGAIEDGKPTKPGSSIWFMTESKERHVVSEYWLSRLGHDIEVENHFAQINAWRTAPFKTYVVEQKVGDFILIPPLAPHQVWNRGTRTIKVAWNRTTVETLEMALNEALPRARMVCRDEQYKNKAIVYFTLQKYSKALKVAEKIIRNKNSFRRESLNDAKVRQLQKDFRRLHALFTQILLSESFSPNKDEKKIEMLPFDSNITCSYCRCNIFNRFLTCPSCIGDLPDGEEDTYDICLDCYAMGRSCACISKLKWVEQFPWSDLVQKHEQWRHQILQTEGQVTEKSPKPLKTEMERLGKKRTLAQICQLELTKRPFHDISKPRPAVEGVEREEEVEVDNNGNVKKKRKVRRSERFIREHGRCHVDCYWEPKWKQAQCSTCSKNFCYGTLYRAYDIMPQDVMANPDWQCPSCRNICGCRHCRTKPGYKPFTPSGTILGHNTKAVADPRSVESLVDFSFSNISWIQKAGDDHVDNTRRLKNRRKAAEEAKAKQPELGDNYVENVNGGTHDEVEDVILRLEQHEGIPVDPALAATDTSNLSQEYEDSFDENPEEGRGNFDPEPRGPPVPQYTVPDGGVIRDAEHAYEYTEAITYDYPDLDGGPVPLTAGNVDRDLGMPLGYESAVPPSPGQIEMTNSKRKRPKLGKDDKAYANKRSSSSKVKKRRSLVVKLTLSKERLVGLNQMDNTARNTSNGLGEAVAPVISSDLHALNAGWNMGDGQPRPKRVRIEHMEVDEDDDFTPSRYRKSAPNAQLRPHLDGDITRRTTRMQAVTYGDPSDEGEIGETLLERSARPRPAAADEVDVDLESLPDSASETIVDDSLDVRRSAAASAARMNGVCDVRVHKKPATSPERIRNSQQANNGSSKAPPAARSGTNTSGSTIAGVPLNGSSRIGTASHAPQASDAKRALQVDQARATFEARQKTKSPTPSRDFSRKMAEAQANRKAKLAMEWMDGYSSIASDEFSEGESDEPAVVKQGSSSGRLAETGGTLRDADQTSVEIVVPRARQVSAVRWASTSTWKDSGSSQIDAPASRQPTGSSPTGPSWTSLNIPVKSRADENQWG